MVALAPRGSALARSPCLQLFPQRQQHPLCATLLKSIFDAVPLPQLQEADHADESRARSANSTAPNIVTQLPQVSR